MPGTKIVLVVDPENETIHAYWSKKKIELFERMEVIDCSFAVEGWKCPEANFFQ